MYYPILRGKQFELIALRELSKILPSHLFRPVLEPVRANIKPLINTIDSLAEFGITPIVIINPNLGDFSKQKTFILSELTKPTNNRFVPCLKINNTNDEALKLLPTLDGEFAVFIENGVDKALIESIKSASVILLNQDKIVPGALALLKNVVLYRNAFNKQVRNADYGERSFFSNLHTEYKNSKNVIGFGDFTILSEEYSESGGPAYVVTIHLSYIDEDEFNAMYVRHFSSFNDDSPTNPGGKFKNALEKLVKEVQENQDVFFKSTGLQGFFELDGKPFPGLALVKKLALKHHIETICDYIKE